MEERLRILDRLDGADLDVFVVGGGINGAVTAAALAGRGVAVGLAERDDFASFTSQESSNLVWGGFKYLENYELGLVHGLCRSRNKLMDAYPSTIREIDFVAALGDTSPYGPTFAALGATAYWAIGHFATRPPRRLSARRLEALEPVVHTAGIRGGLRYADGILPDNDARFVFGFVRSALDSGALAANHLEVVSAERAGGRWHLRLTDRVGDRELGATADVLVNAAGPFVDGLSQRWSVGTDHRIVFSKGVHLIVPRLGSGGRVLAFFDDANRLFYVIPMHDRSVIGTTDTRVDDPATTVTDEDRAFLLEQINDRLDLDAPLTVDDVISERCGVRPLVVDRAGEADIEGADWTSLSRKHAVEVDAERRVVTIFGGKLTDCLNVGEELSEAVADLGVVVGDRRARWYGEPDAAEATRFRVLAGRLGLDDVSDGVDTATERLWRRYGRRGFGMLDRIRDDSSLLDPLVGPVLRIEADEAARSEMIVTPDDFLRRRTMAALVCRADDLAAPEVVAELERLLPSSATATDRPT